MNCWYELVRVAVQQLLAFLSRFFSMDCTVRRRTQSTGIIAFSAFPPAASRRIRRFNRDVQIAPTKRRGRKNYYKNRRGSDGLSHTLDETSFDRLQAKDFRCALSRWKSQIALAATVTCTRLRERKRIFCVTKYV